MNVASFVLPDVPVMKLFVFTEWDRNRERETGRTEEYHARTIEDAAEMCGIVHDLQVREKYGHPLPGVTKLSASGRSVLSDGMFYFVKE